MTETPEYNLPELIKQLQEIQANPPGSLDEEKKKFFIENLTNVYHGLARVLSNFSMEYLDDHDFEDELFKGEMEERSERRNNSSLQKQTAEAKEEEAKEEGAEAAAAAAAEGAKEEGVEGTAAAAAAEGAGEQEEGKAHTGGNKNSKTQKRKNQSQNKTQKNR